MLASHYELLTAWTAYVHAAPVIEGGTSVAARAATSKPSSTPATTGFHRINRWDEDDTLGRKDRRWATQLFVLEGAGSRSLDQIEAILNRDKKDATYKPARLRALAELE